MSWDKALKSRCPACHRQRFIPRSTAPYCTLSCKRDALRQQDTDTSQQHQPVSNTSQQHQQEGTS